MNLYNLRSIAEGHFQIAKFDEDFNVEAIYDLTEGGKRCNCPAGARNIILKPCKHRKMLRFMMGAVNTDRFYDPETETWHEPLAQMALEPEQRSKADEAIDKAVKTLRIDSEGLRVAAREGQARVNSVNDLEPAPPVEELAKPETVRLTDIPMGELSSTEKAVMDLVREPDEPAKPTIITRRI